MTNNDGIRDNITAFVHRFTLITDFVSVALGAAASRTLDPHGENKSIMIYRRAEMPKRSYVYDGRKVNPNPGARRCQYCNEPNYGNYYHILHVYSDGVRLLNDQGKPEAMFVDEECGLMLVGRGLKLVSPHIGEEETEF